jgi:hypothetical protein
MEESGEQCTVVFASIVTETANGEEGGGGGGVKQLPPSTHTHTLTTHYQVPQQLMQRRQCIVLQVPPCLLQWQTELYFYPSKTTLTLPNGNMRTTTRTV